MKGGASTSAFPGDSASSQKLQVLSVVDNSKMQSSISSKVHETATSQEIYHFALNNSKARKRFAKMEKWQRNRARSVPKLKKNEGTKLLKFNSKNQ